MGLHILQWNARSLYANANSLKHYLDTHNNPEIICVQETRFKDNRYIKLQGYHPPIIRNRKIPIQPKVLGGGVAIYVSIQVNFSQLNFNTDNIEVVGVSVNCQNNKINIVNVYRPPNQDIKFDEYQEVLHNLSDNIVLLGDFNSRSSMWGSSTTDSNGNIIEKVIDQNNMIILNDGTGTYQTVTGNRTQIDLTLVSASLANDSQWSVLDEQLGSDHFPVLTVLNAKPVKNKVCTPQRWVYDKADWHRFTTLCNEINIDNIKHDDIEIFNQNLCEVVTKIADETIPKTSGTIHTRKNCPWWNDDCTNAKKNKRHKHRVYDKSKSEENHELYKTAVKEFKRVTDKAKTDYWQNFCDKLNYKTNVKTVWNTVKGLKGAKSSTLPTLINDTKQAVSNVDKANMLAGTFAEASSDNNLDPKFRTHKLKTEIENQLIGMMMSNIIDFLQDRKIQVKVNQESSDEYDLNNGIPQGSVISPTLFNIMINDLVGLAKKPAVMPQFADDSAMWYRGGNIKHLTKKMQETLNNISAWSKKWGFKISKTKTIGVIFGDRHVYSVNLMLDNQPIKFQNHVKFLGLIFDRKLTWNKHVNYLQERSKAILNVLRYVQANNYGMGTDSLLMLYKSLLRSVLDYGCQAFNSASITVKSKLDIIQAKGLRIVLGAHKSTPLETILAESGEMPLQLRRDHLSLKYYARTKQNPSNPANQLVDDCIEYQIYNHKWNDHNIPYGFRVQNLLKDNELDKIKLVTKNIQDPPPWIIGQAKTSSNIKNSLSKKENPHIIKTKALEYIDNAYKNHLKIYTDGSKDPASGKTGYAFLIPSKLIASYKRTSDNLSVYTTEMTAIYQSLKWVFSNQQPGQKVVILTDSYSAIQSINNNASSRPDILEPIQILACRLKQNKIEVIIEWIPAHVGILGNEQVDKLAKLALSNDKIDLNLSLSANEFIAITTALYKKKWQARWDNTCSLWSRSINTAVNKNPTFIKKRSLRRPTTLQELSGVSDSEMESGHNRQYRWIFKTTYHSIIKGAKHTARVIRVSDSEMESGHNRQ
ncbi:unnamed protein product [Mytilus edulis]|uniref:Pol-like protein n=1 Tax=Mytilus edulis TaxID=6550 RepID=A0A8S3SLB1_MYTED|nr:unnamed protein product [Mytilus edulis]